jgi:HEAT repeat protein
LAKIVKSRKSVDPKTRVSAVVALGRIRDPVAVSALTAALDDEEYRDFGAGISASPAFAAIKALGEMGADQGIEPLVALLSSGRSTELRSAAALALGRIGGDRSVAPLIAALHDSSGELEEGRRGTGGNTVYWINRKYPVRQAAATALKMIGTPDAKRALEAAPPTVEGVAGGFVQ